MPDLEIKIFLKQENIKVGFGSTGKSTCLENYYQTVEIDEHNVQIRLLDIQDQPMGKPMEVDKETLSKEYIYCPDYFKNKKKPNELKADKHVLCGDQHLQRKEFLSAEFEYHKALATNGSHLKANLGMGKTLSALGKEEKAKEYYTKLSSIEDLYDKENKYIFNELGIELRKKGMFVEAIANYEKAIMIDPDDPVIYYNLARVYYEKGEIVRAREQMEKALQVKPDFREAEEFIQSIAASLPPS
ncbi:MAG: tetratricopeptide repeat protein [Deltaproteobacteria bacterium]|nr:tetratricopeptide repeat protein [Deltaproteobacteria bacterium]